MKRYTFGLCTLIGSACCNLYSQGIYAKGILSQQGPSTAPIISNKQDTNFSPSNLKTLTKYSEITHKSDYINLKFDSYISASETLTNTKKNYLKRGFKLLSECDGLACGNSLQLAKNINSINFISEKRKQSYSLLYINYNWLSIHLSSYENNHFVFLRQIEGNFLKNSIKRLLFNRDSYALSTNVKKSLNSLIPAMKGSEYDFYIIGHSDNSGSAEHNYKLAKQRALSVYKYLVSNGVSKNKLIVESAGENTPLYPNSTQKNRILNRRVELIESL
ncbi:OmpA family protein [Pseudoalteromonas shioyasakiensis]|uniref:OmpA family protein n=1 Tax=Pseudoalteromonas shioyasakiensis TaxID=1190813 RepID=UPI0021190009|nr:OmpA family protein [Pseudoalteromonas shioyasakiensis]MCQ8876790.1 OmpA family protein [Pseudoalteromonas shioyasakiensis]